MYSDKKYQEEQITSAFPLTTSPDCIRQANLKQEFSK